jgi:hypothetical protein
MKISTNRLHLIISQSLKDFFDKERDSILDRVSERNNCQRLSIYLEHHAKAAGITGYYADTEYNRKQGGAVKTILDDEFQIITIQSDLILHSRGKFVDEDNLIAVEMKKVERPKKEKDSDRNRLRAMTKESYDGVWSADGTTHPEHVCNYRLGLFIELDATNRRAMLERYEKGAMIETYVRRF